MMETGRENDAEGFMMYATSNVYPEWITQHSDYADVDRIIWNEQLSQALNESDRSSKQVNLLEMYLLSVWPTARRLGSLGVKEVARTARFLPANKGDFIVKEGERGGAFYIILSGTLEVQKHSKTLALLNSGQSFGEASLVTGALCNASIVVTQGEARLLVLQRHEYDEIMKEFREAEHRRAYKCIKSVPLFARWSRTRLEQICTLLQWNYYQKGEVIIKQGDAPTNVYFIIDGRCDVSKLVHIRKQNRWPTGKRSWVTKTFNETVDVLVAQLGPNDYFGEKGILENTERAATVTAAQDDVVVTSLDRIAFIELLQHGRRNRYATQQQRIENMGYATEQEIISVLSATASDVGGGGGDALSTTSCSSARSSSSTSTTRRASISDRLAKRRESVKSAVEMLATGAGSATADEAVDKSNDDEITVVTQVQGNEHEIELAKRELEARFQLHRLDRKKREEDMMLRSSRSLPTLKKKCQPQKIDKIALHVRQRRARISNMRALEASSSHRHIIDSLCGAAKPQTTLVPIPSRHRPSVKLQLG